MGVLIRFFPSSKGPRDGDSFSPYLFVIGMEVLSIVLQRAMDEGFISSSEIRGRGKRFLRSHIFFL